MPRRKRFRNGRGHKKMNKLKNRNENIASESIDVARVSPASEICSDDCLLSGSKETFLSPTLSERPRPVSEFGDTPLNNNLSPDIPLITETPINKRRSWNRDRKSIYGSMNVTNLNLLFETNYMNNSPKSECDVTIGRNTTLQRSKSSIAKLHSPGKEKPLSVNQSTQTIETDICLKQSNQITETPKLGTIYLQDNASSKSQFFKKSDFYNKNDLCPDKITRFYEKGVNINPYLKSKETDLKNRNGSVGELSFFSPNLFHHKTSSTPIEKILNTAMEFDEQAIISELNVSKLDLPNSFIDNSFGTPKLNANLNVNDGISPDKLANKEDSMKNLINNSKIYRKTPNTRISPTTKNLIHSRVYSKNRHFSGSKLNVSRRSSIDGTKLATVGACGKVLLRLKRYCTASQTWSNKVMDVCTQLGVQIKNSLSSICNLYKDTSLIVANPLVQCQCEIYKKDIEDLKEEIAIQKKRSDDLTDELKKVKEEIISFASIRKEIQVLKEKCNCVPPPSAPCIPPSAPVLPPPPPPPPPPPSFLTTTNTLKITKRSDKTSICEKENSRPVISLDDILKVKLKKTADRQQTPVNRFSSSQPLVSMDMLRQVKLRPASRNSLTTDTPENIAELTTSPHSSLCRLLKNESSMPRLKRLRRVGAYSYDSLYRKKELSRRERDIS